MLPRKKLEDEYMKIKQIGKGAQGTVYLARNMDNKLVAIKELNIPTEKAMAMASLEIKNLKLLSYSPCHPNISCYVDAFRDESINSKIYLVLEYYAGETLFDMPKKLRTLYEDDNFYYQVILDLLITLLKTLNYIHEFGVIHGDIKLSNIQIISESKVSANENITQINTFLKPILLDFGLSCNLTDDSCLKFVGTPNFVAPELAKAYITDRKTARLTRATDIWALGICFYALLNGRIWPTSLINARAVIEYIASSKYKLVINVPNVKLSNILNHMLDNNPDNRLSASQLLEL